MSLFTPPDNIPATETEVVGRRVGAVLVDALIIFGVFYTGIRVADGTLIIGSLVTVFGFLFWYLFSVLMFMPLLILHGFSWMWYVAAIGIWIVYGTIFEATIGQTIGKRLFGVVVTGVDGDRCTLPAAAIRNTLRLIDGLVFYGLGLLVLSFTERRQRLGDLFAGTVVTRVTADTANTKQVQSNPKS